MRKKRPAWSLTIALPNSVRILIVDDVEHWRTEIRRLLDQELESQMVAEASSGFAAIEEANQLRPDLVLLDIGLPDLDGVQVAERIRKVSPNSKIIFVTLNDNADLANTLIADGAQGYLLKVDLSTELIPAIVSVLADGRFLSERLKR